MIARLANLKVGVGRDTAIAYEVHHHGEEATVLNVADALGRHLILDRALYVQLLEDGRILGLPGLHIYLSVRVIIVNLLAKEQEEIHHVTLVNEGRLFNRAPDWIQRRGGDDKVAAQPIIELPEGSVPNHHAALPEASNIDLSGGNAIRVNIVLDEAGELLASFVERIHIVCASLVECSLTVNVLR